METAIFPSYFHGKCQVNGVNPPGCPNPDCPVVCGTPGSLVHFFPTLRGIAYNQTRKRLDDLAKKHIEHVQECASKMRRTPRRLNRCAYINFFNWHNPAYTIPTDHSFFGVQNMWTKKSRKPSGIFHNIFFGCVVAQTRATTTDFQTVAGRYQWRDTSLVSLEPTL